MKVKMLVWFLQCSFRTELCQNQPHFVSLPCKPVPINCSNNFIDFDSSVFLNGGGISHTFWGLECFFRL